MQNNLRVGILLAAGIGRRFNETMELSHKCFMKVDDQTFLENTLQQLDSVSELIYVAVGHKSEIIVKEIENLRRSIEAEIVIVDNEQYSSTNNVTSMQKVIQHMRDFNINPAKVFYAESDIYYAPSANIYKRLDEFEKQNVRASVYVHAGQNEWMISFNDDQSFKNYDDDDTGGLAIIGASKYSNEMFRQIMNNIDYVAEHNDQTYWDEAERMSLTNNKTFAMHLRNNEIIEIDNKNDFDKATALGYNIQLR